MASEGGSNVKWIVAIVLLLILGCGGCSALSVVGALVGPSIMVMFATPSIEPAP